MSNNGLGKCSICSTSAVVNYPLLAGSPRFCSRHYNSRDAGPFGCDFSGPDDFDIPIPEDNWNESYYDPYEKLEAYTSKRFKGWRKKFVWKDKEGAEHKLKDIDNLYLHYIIEFLRRKISIGTYFNGGVLRFLEDELVYRRKEGSL